MSKRPKIYLAGPFRDNPSENTFNAQHAAATLYCKGYTVYSPHLETYGPSLIVEEDMGPQSDFWLEVVAEWLPVCDALAWFGDIENSKGTQKEIEIAKELGVVAYPIDEFPEAGDFWRRKKSFD